MLPPQTLNPLCGMGSMFATRRAETSGWDGGINGPFVRFTMQFPLL